MNRQDWERARKSTIPFSDSPHILLPRPIPWPTDAELNGTACGIRGCRVCYG